MVKATSSRESSGWGYAQTAHCSGAAAVGADAAMGAYSWRFCWSLVDWSCIRDNRAWSQRMPPDEQFSRTRCGYWSSTPSSQSSWARLWPSRPAPGVSPGWALVPEPGSMLWSSLR